MLLTMFVQFVEAPSRYCRTAWLSGVLSLLPSLGFCQAGGVVSLLGSRESGMGLVVVSLLSVRVGGDAGMFADMVGLLCLCFVGERSRLGIPFIPSGFVAIVGSFFLGALFMSLGLCCLVGVITVMQLEAEPAWPSSTSSLQSLVVPVFRFGGIGV